MIDPEFKYHLAAALMSGKYRQGRGRLVQRSLGGNGLSYCCLGVACIVYGLKTIDAEGGFIEFLDSETGFGEGAFLPLALKNRYGFDSISPAISVTSPHDQELLLSHLRAAFGADFRPNFQLITLVNLNDAGVPFHIIAQMILRYM